MIMEVVPTTQTLQDSELRTQDGLQSSVLSPQSLIPVATGKAQNGNPFDITLAAYAVGREDAEQGEPFAPEMLYVKALNKYEYALGFLSVQPFCAAALAMASEFELVQYEIAQGIEPAYQPTLLDFEITF